MKTSEADTRKPGGTIDAWCGKCKLLLAHTIEAMLGDTPARVQCNTCKAQHSYKPNKPKTTVRRASQGEAGGAPVTRQSRARANAYQALLNGSDKSVPRKYSMADTYAAGDLLQHPIFGLGVTIAVKDGTKIEALFEGGSKLLIHGR